MVNMLKVLAHRLITLIILLGAAYAIVDLSFDVGGRRPIETVELYDMFIKL